jgi:hypothetical protein
MSKTFSQIYEEAQKRKEEAEKEKTGETVAVQQIMREAARLPYPYADENWREAYRADSGEAPRMASYQAPGGKAIPFIQKSFRFSGGQAKDTAEYPFGGQWSNEYLNEKPQSLTVDGFLRGPGYIAQRNRLIEALRVPTDDEHPGYIDLPFWGRFPVVVGDNYEVSENTDEQGQCTVSLSFIRAGVSIDERVDAQTPANASVEEAAERLKAAAIGEFEASLTEKDTVTFASAFGQIKTTLLSILGRIQGAKTALNAMTGEVLGVIDVINQGIRTPANWPRPFLMQPLQLREVFWRLKTVSPCMAGKSIRIPKAVPLAVLLHCQRPTTKETL